LLFHSIELALIATIMAVSSSNQSILDVPYLIIAFVLAYQLQLINEPKQAQLIRAKRIELFLCLCISLLVLVTKVAIIESKVLDPTKYPVDEDMSYWETLGFRFHANEGDTTYTINWTLTLLADGLMVVITILYLIFLKWLGAGMRRDRL